jgi:integrase
LQVERERRPGRYGDGGGLWLQVSKTGTKAWLFRYQHAGKARAMGLGAFPDVSLVEAREQARYERQRLSQGLDPIAERHTRRAEEHKATVAATMTLKQAALAVIKLREGRWTRLHHAEWTRTFALAYPALGDMPVSAIDTAAVMRVVEPVWKRTQVTGERLRQRIETVLAWAAAHEHRDEVNPARWKKHLEYLLPAKAKVRHHPALPYAELPGFMATLREQEGMAARALEFTILTAARSGEVIGAQWVEVEGDVWTIPGERMKARKPHTVPLSPLAMRLLKSLPHADAFIFTGRHPGRPLERHAMADALKAINGGTVTTHGFRSAFMDWATEQTDAEREVREQCLAHSISGAVERAYRRGALLEKQRKLMNLWADYCNSGAKS